MAGYVDIGINPITNDLFSEDGKVGFVDANDEVVQRVKTRLRRILGEWFLQTTAGIPYFNGDMLGGKNRQYVLLVIKAEILNTIGVQDILALGITYNSETRKATVDVTIVVNAVSYSITEEI